jgi:putative toxin-antitoxin system antitoxin component (TIGR02293 family)
VTTTATSARDIARTRRLLGGAETLGRTVRTGVEVHDLLIEGLPSAALAHLLREMGPLAAEASLAEALGVPPAAIVSQRWTGGAGPLSIGQGGRVWTFAAILGRAIHALGGRERAEAWLDAPAAGLEGRRPIDLLRSAAGAAAVEDLVKRIDYGIER